MTDFKESQAMWAAYGDAAPFWSSLLKEPRYIRPGPEDKAEFWASGVKDVDRIETLARAVGTTLVGKEVLDHGCGIGRVAHGLRSVGAKAITAADVSMPHLKEAMKHMPADPTAATIKFRLIADEAPLGPQVDPDGNGFDVVVSLLTLHHMRPAPMKAAIRDLLGLLGPASWAFLHIAFLVPGSQGGSGGEAEKTIEVHPLSIPDFKDLLAECGCACKAVGDGHDWIGGGIKNALFAVCRVGK
jgi:SAM-dependent methyltransferase